MTAYFDHDAASPAFTDDDLDLGIEPTSTTVAHPGQVAPLVLKLLEALGEDPTREGLVKTPQRVERAMAFLTQGYHQSLGEIVNDALFDSDHDDIVLVRDIEIFSMCEHHMLPFWGTAHVAYIPSGKVIGLSKLPRIADMFSRRLQIQERLTAQIALAVDTVLQPRGVAVVTECNHMCMMMRGVQKNQSITVCRTLRGAFKTDESLRRDLSSMLSRQSPA